MKAPTAFRKVFSRWIDAVASTIATLGANFNSPVVIKFVESKAGDFLLETPLPSSPSDRIQIVNGRVDQAGSALLATLPNSRVQLVLQPDRFLFRPIELPARAAEFLNGIVRSQIDRLTPWNTTDAAFGWSKPIEAGADRIVVTVAAIARNRIMPFVQAILGAGAQSVVVLTCPAQDGVKADSIEVWEETPHKALHAVRIRRSLIGLLAAFSVITGAALSADFIVSTNLDSRQIELARRTANARAAAGMAQASASSSLVAMRRKLEERKNGLTPAVVILDALSRIVPDHTYITELRVEGDRVRLVGVTRDAPSLIELLEQSGQFTQASFFAPTTQSTSSSGENFHIEITAKPIAAPPA